MKQVFLFFLTLACLNPRNSEAGVLYNRDSKETVEFLVEGEELHIISHSRSFTTRSIPLSEIKAPQEMKLLLSQLACDSNQKNGKEARKCKATRSFFTHPLMFPLTLSLVVTEMVTLPVNGPIRSKKNARNREDFQKLQRAITTKGEVVVSGERFKRISKLFKSDSLVLGLE